MNPFNTIGHFRDWKIFVCEVYFGSDVKFYLQKLVFWYLILLFDLFKFFNRNLSNVLQWVNGNFCTLHLFKFKKG